MADVADERFKCPGCGKRFRWTSAIAGRKTRCTACNLKIRVPGAPGGKAEALEPLPEGAGPAAPAPSPKRPAPKPVEENYDLNLDDDLMGLAPTAPVTPPSLGASGGEAKCPSCNQKVKPGAVICINCGFNLQAGKKISTKVEQAAEDDAPAGKARPAGGGAAALPQAGLMAAYGGKRLDEQALAEEMEGQHRFKEKVLPLIVFGIGLAIAASNVLFLGPAAMEAAGYTDWYGNPLSHTEYMKIAVLTEVIRTVIQLPTLFIAVLVVARLFGTSFGLFIPAVIKMFALALVAGATDQAVGYGLDIATGGFGGIGWMLQWSVSVAIFFALATWLLETDVMETLVLWLIVTFLPFFAMLFGGAAILSMFM